jgi:tRNA threonylcarbamoyladenosine biosynthesis protein TsaE
MEEKIYLTISDEDTRNLASKLTSKFVGGDVVLLFGPMGSGKTTFTQGIALALGISRLTSPTYVILNQYDIKINSPIKTLNHFDLYRLESEDQLKSVNFEEIINDPDSLSIVEWPGKLSKLPLSYYQINIETLSASQRQITFQKI